VPTAQPYTHRISRTIGKNTSPQESRVIFWDCSRSTINFEVIRTTPRAATKFGYVNYEIVSKVTKLLHPLGKDLLPDPSQAADQAKYLHAKEQP
jgi:hypothetical protein